MRYGSLFSGIGGLDLAMEACGHAPLWQVEMDAFCNGILDTHGPDLQRYMDIREINWAVVDRPDLLCGGFPCQPFSVAGQNRGVDDDRNMWPETYRAVRELGPRYVFLENVPGLLAHGYFGRILGDLAEGGYDAVWDTFTAAEVGAPHRRERLFILAYAGHESQQLQQRRAGPELAGEGVRVADAAGSRQRTGLGDDDAGQPDAAGNREEREELAHPNSGGRESPRWAEESSPVWHDGNANDGPKTLESGSVFPPGPDDRDAWTRVLAEVPALEPAVCRVATGVPDRTHRLRALGNAVVPAQGAYAFRFLWQRMIEE